MASRVLGIDPGLSGGLALLVEGKVVDAWNMPTFTTVRNKKNRRELDVSVIIKIMAIANPGLVVIERQQAYRGQGVSSTFQTGKNFGILLGLLSGLNLHYENVTPQAWKKALSLSSDKEKSFALANDLFPDAMHFWKRKKDDGVAEAALLAHYGSNYL